MDRGLDDEVVRLAGDSVVRVMERSPGAQRATFVRANSFSEEESADIEALYDAAASLWAPRACIYLRASPQRAYERMSSRGRSSETRVPLQYIEQLHSYHECYFEQVPGAVVVDVDDMLPQQVADAVESVIAGLNLHRTNRC